MPFVPFTQLPTRPVDWLWLHRLARGHLHILDGDPGRGKSLVLLDLAARITTGRPLPDGASAGPPAAVVLLTAEDGAADTIGPRLIAAGADLTRLVFWDRPPGESGFRLPSQLPLLEEILCQHRPALVVLDPLLAFLDPGLNIGSDPCVRQALTPLADLAEAYHCAIILLRHLNKHVGGPVLYRGLASIAFTALCRIAWLVGPDPRLPGRYVLSQSKNNLDAATPSLAYTIEPGASGAAHICWQGPCSWSDADLLRHSTPRDQERRRACAFLAALLKDGPRSHRDIMAAARPEGLSDRALRRAAKVLKVTTQRVGHIHEHTTYWLLPQQQLPAQVRPEGFDVVEESLRRLEAQYPSSRLEEDGSAAGVAEHGEPT